MTNADAVRDRVTRAGESLLTVGADGRITYASRYALTALGLADEPVVGRTLAALADRLDSADLRRLAMDLAGGTLGRAEIVTLTGSDGTAAEMVALPADSGVALFVAGGRSPDGRTEEERRLALLDRVLSTVRDAVLVTTAEPIDDPGPVIVYANAALERHTGYGLDELLGRSPRLLQGDGTDRAELDRLRAALEEWRPVTVELVNYRKDGTPFWVEIDIVPLADATGWFTHWVSVQRDVTERKERERRQVEEMSLVQNILDSLPAQTAMIGHDGRIISVNRPWRDFWTEAGDQQEPEWTTVDYLAVCAAAAGQGGDDGVVARAAHDGIVAVLRGTSPEFGLDYECWDGRRMRWFHLNAVPIVGGSGVVVTHSDITARKEAEERLGHQATHDDLTGLPNRTLLRHHLDDVLRTDRGAGSTTAVAYVDLDNFKDVNDAYGHVYGDELLRVVGRRLVGLVRPQDLVARIGGDEYVLVLAGLSPRWDPEEFFQRLRTTVGESVPLGVASVRPSLSIGLVTAPPHTGGVDAVLRDADTAMYAAKRSGRDRWAAFSSAVRDSALARVITEDRIATALGSEGFVLHVQPVVDLDDGSTLGVEALLRLPSDDGGLLLPGHFLPAVENGPLAEEVGLWVLDRALAVLAGWLPRHPDVRMSVNVSPRMLGHGRLPDQVSAALNRHGAPARLLLLEMTEESLLEVGGRAAPELAALRAAGVRIAVDDFGTGYSALSYLQEARVDVLKIDRVFLDLERGRGGSDLLTAIGGLARAAGASAVAEGIETREQLDLVRRAGITRGQGFLLGRPAEPGPQPPIVVPGALGP